MSRNSVKVNVLRVESARLRRGLFSRELASAAGVSLTSLHTLRKSGRAGLRVARSVAKALDLPIGEVVMGDD